MSEILTAAYAIAAALERLKAVEPLIARTPAGAVIAIWLDNDGLMQHECIVAPPFHPQREKPEDLGQVEH